VSSDEEAINLMNDSPYGLTASIWTNAAAHPTSEDAFVKLTDELHTGTVFLNRWGFFNAAKAHDRWFTQYIGVTFWILRLLGLA
jgi:acyl-CoA reductase-like NAD-dependent aldehyde dehydrogenase